MRTYLDLCAYVCVCPCMFTVVSVLCVIEVMVFLGNRSWGEEFRSRNVIGEERRVYFDY